MFSLFTRPLIKNSNKFIQERLYWIESKKPSHDIITTIDECQTLQLTYVVHKNYTNYILGGTIDLDVSKLLHCEKFKEVKQSYEDRNFKIKIKNVLVTKIRYH